MMQGRGTRRLKRAVLVTALLVLLSVAEQLTLSH
jgi:hypothetical protein